MSETGTRGSTKENAASVLRVAHLTHQFEIDTSKVPLQVIADVSFELAPQEVVALVGPSGSGKTTFLNLITGMMKPTRGEVLLAPGVGPASGRAGGLGMVFQQPALLPWRTLSENIRLPLELVPIDRDQAEVVAGALELVDLSEFESYLPHQVSSGMRSRAAFARALTTTPKLLLMDEPFSALDEITAQNLTANVSQILQEREIATLFVTHNLEQAAFLANRVVVFSRRPATIIGEVTIDFDMPRNVSVLDDPRFWNCVKQIRRILRNA